MNDLYLEWNNQANGYKGKAKAPDGRKIKVSFLPDDLEDSPREWDNLGTMVCFHSRYILGDEQPGGRPDEWLRDLACSLDPTAEDRIWYWEDGPGYDRADSAGRVDAIIEKVLDREVPVILPLYLYDHSGITMSVAPFSCGWDSGQVGWIYVSRADLLKEYSAKRITKAIRERAEKVLRQEVATYDDYLTGNVWGYDLKVGGEDRDGCWGYFGNPGDYLLSEVNSILKQYGVQAHL